MRSSAASSRAKYSGLANSSAASSGASSSGARGRTPPRRRPRHRPGDQCEAEEPAQPRRRRQSRQHPHRRRPGGDGDEGQRQPAAPARGPSQGAIASAMGRKRAFAAVAPSAAASTPGAAGLQQHQLPGHPIDEQRGPERPAQPQPGRGRHRRAEGEEAHPHGDGGGAERRGGAGWEGRGRADMRGRASCHAPPPAPAAWRGRKARPGADGKGLSGSRRRRQAGRVRKPGARLPPPAQDPACATSSPSRCSAGRS